MREPINGDQTETKPSASSSITPQALSRFFKRFFCPRVIIIRDRLLEQRAMTTRVKIDKDVGHGNRFSAKDQKIEPELMCDSDAMCTTENTKLVKRENPECTVCRCVTNSVRVKEELGDVICTTCEDCINCLLKERSKRFRVSDEPIRVKCYDYTYSKKIVGEKPTLVDLTHKELEFSRKRSTSPAVCVTLNDVEEPLQRSNSETGELRIMIADSSSKFEQESNGVVIATALRDRGTCVIPAQPNPSLPIRPAPPVPMRAASCIKSRKKNTFLMNSKENDEENPLQSFNLKNCLKLNEDNSNPHFTDLCEELNVKIPYKNLSIDTKKKNKSSLFKNSYLKREKQSKRKKKSRKDRSNYKNSAKMSNICNKISSSFNDDNVPFVNEEKEKEQIYKVPPLRLKKIVSEDSFNRGTMRNETQEELNYRIVTGATPCPPSPLIIIEVDQISSFDDKTFQDEQDIDVTNETNEKLVLVNSNDIKMSKEIGSSKQLLEDTHIKSISEENTNDSANFIKRDENYINDKDYSFEEIDENKELANHKSSIIKLFSMESPEPPKLSPTSVSDLEDKTPEEVRNSPPILPRVNLSEASSNNGTLRVLSTTEVEEWFAAKSLLTDVSPNNNPEQFMQKFCQKDDDTNKEIFVLAEKSSTKTKNNEISDISALQNPVNELMLSNYASPERLVIDEMTEMSDTNNLNISLNQQSNVYKSDIIATTRIQPLSPSSNTNNQLTKPNYCDLSKPTVSVDKNEDVMIIPSNSDESTSTEISLPDCHENKLSNATIDSKNVQSSNQSTIKNLIMTEQFPTFGSWVQAQIPKKRKRIGDCNCLETSSELSTLVPNNVTNVNSQWNSGIWQIRQEKQKQNQKYKLKTSKNQKVPQKNITTITSPKSNSTITTSCQRYSLSNVPVANSTSTASCPSRFYGPNTMSQFYPNDYTINSFGNTPGCIPTYSYDRYQLQNRISYPITPVNNYQLSLQNQTSVLHSMQHNTKQLLPPQDATAQFMTNTMKCAPNFSTGVCPPRLDFGSISSRHNNDTGCLPSFLLPLSQVPDNSVSVYPIIDNQFKQDELVPETVAIAAVNAVRKLQQQGILRTKRFAPISTTKIPYRENFNEVHNMLVEGFPVVVRKIHQNKRDGLNDKNTKSKKTQIELSNNFNEKKKLITNHEKKFCKTPYLGKVNNTPKSQKCSNCGRSDSLFKCLGCEVTFYCDDNCQSHHWSKHVEKCPKKMPKLKKLT